MLCYNFSYSDIHYGIIVWGTTAKSLLLGTEVTHNNNVIRMITWSKKICYVTKLY